MIIATLFLLSILAPGAVAAQATTGTSTLGLYYEVSGSGDPLVLIHGFSLDRRMWEPQIALLERRFRVVRYDLRGHGKSAAPDAPYAQHEDLRSVLDALGIGRATLIGLSAGSEIAVDFAMAYPNRVTRLVLVASGPSGYVPPAPLTWMQPVLEAAGKGDAAGAAKRWAETPIMALHSDRSAAPLVREIVDGNARLWTYRTNPVQRLTPPAITRLGEIKCPTLVVLGEQDLPHIRDAAGLLASGIAGATLVIIPRAGHLVNLDAREEFNKTLEIFLKLR